MELNYNTILLLLFIALVVYLLCLSSNNANSENFTNKYIANDHQDKGHRRDGQDLTDDSLFKNVVTYENDDNLYQDCNARTAIDKCLDECSSQKCIEFRTG